jgi:uncharacterized protein DUF5681
MTAPQTTSASYEVGYRKPPRHTQFQKGQSGNPGGRPRRSLARRLEDLALYEAYRPTIVMVDGHAEPMPAIQAVLRSQLQSAAGGNVRAQRDILAMIQHIEVVRDVLGTDSADDDVVDDDDAEDADAIDGDDNDVDDTADADGDDAGGADDGEPARKQADGIDTYGERRQAERGVLHPPLKGEGRTATDLGFTRDRHFKTGVHRQQPMYAGSPGWGDGRATPPPYPPPQAGEGREGEFAEPLSPPPGPLMRADLPPAEPRYSEGSATQQRGRSRQQPTSAGGGEEAPFPAVSPPTRGSGSGQRRGVLPRRNGPERSAGVQPARPQPGRRRRSAAVNAGKIRGGIAEARGVRRAGPIPDPARPRLQAGTPARRPPRPNKMKN